MSEHVFSDPNAESERRILDDIEHPLIYDLALSEERQAVEKNPDAVVVHDIPLLAEVIDDIPMRFDHIVTVEAPEQTRVERMMRTRGMSEAQAKARIAHQPTRAARESIADAVIDSSQDVEHMFDCVDRLMEQWRKEARRNHGIQH
ncbi:Dephospho-CoA kinase [Bifidobacterium adolescentis L2-32]|jgi:dephospho-CoA kinase|nr:Dephospho-CoA kinase [Bifidobacterium adolescentis L2-32]